MKSEQFLELLETMEKEEKEILLCKGKEYARDDYKDDVLSNFKRIAKALEVDPIKVWAVYFMKHIDAILNFVNTGRTASDETIKGRFADARNYLALGFGLVWETIQGNGLSSIHEGVNLSSAFAKDFIKQRNKLLSELQEAGVEEPERLVKESPYIANGNKQELNKPYIDNIKVSTRGHD